MRDEIDLDERNQISGLPRPGLSERVRQALPWGRRLVRLLVAAVAAQACLVLLQVLGLAPYLAIEPIDRSAPKIRLDPIPDELSHSELTVSGLAHPFSNVTVGINKRPIMSTFTDSTGRFKTTLIIPPQAYILWVQAHEDTGSRGQRVEKRIRFAWDAAFHTPVLSVGIYIGDIGQLWVAGQTMPWAPIRLETESGDVLKEDLQADGIGVFEQFIPLATEPKAQLMVRSASRDSGLPSAPRTIRSLPLADLPLARTTDVHVTSGKTTLALEILLPPEHPYFRALAQGYISADEFIDASFGLFRSFPRRLIPALTIRSNAGIVRFEGGWETQIAEFRLTNNHWSKGMASVPLLSAKDQVTLHFSEHRPAWFDDPLPGELTADTAIWRGPIPTQEYTQIVGFGITTPQQAPLEEQPREKTALGDEEESLREELTLREFLASFEYREAPNVVSRTLGLLISLIPYAGLLWLARSSPFDRVEAWQSLIAATVVLAVWRSWDYFYWLAVISSDVWLRGVIAPILYTFFDRVGRSEGYYQVLRDAGVNAFWLMFVVFVALVPFYLPAVARVRLNWRPEPVRPHHRSGLRRALVRSLGALRFLYGTATLAMLLVAAYWIWLRREINPLTEDVRLGELRSSSMLNLLQTWLGHPLIIDRAAAWLDNPVFASLLPFGLLTLFLLTLGGRAALFGLGLLAVASHVAVTYHVTSGRPVDELSALAVIGQVPWWAVLILAGLTTYPLFLRLVRVLTPFARDRPGIHWLLAVGLIVAALGLPHLPAQGLLVAGGCLMVVGIGWLIVEGLGKVEPIRSLADWAHRWPWLFVAALVAIGLVIGWPRPEPGSALRFDDLYTLASWAASVFAYVLALGLILLLWDHAGERPSVILDQPTLSVGIYLFAVFLSNSAITWLFIPIPFLIGWFVARFWLFRPAADMDRLGQALAAGPPDQKRLIQDVLDADEAGGQFAAVQKALTSQLEAATLTPTEYEEKVRLYKTHFEQKLVLEEVTPGVNLQEAVFAVGDRQVKANVLPAVKIGALLASLPFLIAIYEYLPASRVSYPYPLANLLVFLIQAAANWLLYAFFFGYYLAHLRGRSGLAKGGYLFLGLTIPFAVYRLLGAQSLDEMRPFIFWVAQLFLFCSLLGLLAADYRMLLQNGFRARDIKAVHHLPALSAYASTVIAAVVPAILALLTGRLKDLVTFFLETVLPGVPPGGQ